MVSVMWDDFDQGVGLVLEVNRAVAGNSIGRARLGVEVGKVQPVSGETSENRETLRQ